jgi:hypothetical protein
MPAISLSGETETKLPHPADVRRVSTSVFLRIYKEEDCEFVNRIPDDVNAGFLIDWILLLISCPLIRHIKKGTIKRRLKVLSSKYLIIFLV